MPVTKTAKRALRGSLRKAEVNKLLVSRMEIALRIAKKTEEEKEILKAVSLTDRLAKRKIIHKNKAARIKSRLSKLFKDKPKNTKVKKTSVVKK